MKALLGWAIAAQLTCPDFSGAYQWIHSDGPEVSMQVTQETCDRLRTLSQGNSVEIAREMILDGQKRVTFETDAYVTRQSFRWEGNRISFDTEDEWLDDGHINRSRGTVYLDERGDYVQVTHYLDEQGQVLSKGVARYRRTGRLMPHGQE